jgi:predicted DNA-binding ribbon-helix-helix protein
MTLHPPRPDRVQTGVRMERRLVKVLKAVAELRDLSLGELLEDLVRDAFRGRKPFAEPALTQIAELMRIYGFRLDGPATAPAPAPEGE